MVYLLYGESDFIHSEGEMDIAFALGDKCFRHMSDYHEHQDLSKTRFQGLRFADPNDLIEMEHSEYLKTAKEVEKESGFRPVPPIGHSILRVYIVIPKKKKHTKCMK